MRSSLALCSCNGTLAVDPQAIRQALELDEAPELFDNLPGHQCERFRQWLGGVPRDRVVVGCCASADLVREVASAAGTPASRVDVVNVREGGFTNARAARLLRAAMRTVSMVPPASGIPVSVGPTVLIVGDSPTGVALARRLQGGAEPRLILGERSSEQAPLPWKVDRGRVLSVEGSLGAFRVTVERQRRIGPRPEPEIITAGQVVVIDGQPDGRPTRTGHHRLAADSSPAAVEALGARILGLIGEFEKPTYVRYDPSTCAGGASGHQACGRCVSACPYEVVTRRRDDPLRMAVDHAACEGCGACVAVCPTSSLTYTEPPTALLDARLRALLAPVPGVPSAPLVVAYHCPEQGAAALEDAGRTRGSSAPALLPMPMACLRHVSEADLLSAFRYGAAGVGLIGCEACPHGERQALLDRLAVVRTVLEAFGLGSDRIQVIAGPPAEATAALERFAAALGPSPVHWEGDGAVPSRGREAIADAIQTLIATTAREPGATAVPAGAPFAVPDVRVAGCTVCRACVNVCPTHAFRFDEAHQALELKTIACVNCGLCAQACPESVITLRPHLALERAALEYATVVHDDKLLCTKCGVAFGNRRAIEVIEAKLFDMASLLDTFAAGRRNLLRMCPNCRAVAAVAAMQQGWEP